MKAIKRIIASVFVCMFAVTGGLNALALTPTEGFFDCGFAAGKRGHIFRNVFADRQRVFWTFFPG